MNEREVYTAAFKREAVRLSEQAGISVAQIAQELGVSDYSLYKWRKKARESGALSFPRNGKVALSAEQQENVRLRKKLEQAMKPVSKLERASSATWRASTTPSAGTHPWATFPPTTSKGYTSLKLLNHHSMKTGQYHY